MSVYSRKKSQSKALMFKCQRGGSTCKCQGGNQTAGLRGVVVFWSSYLPSNFLLLHVAGCHGLVEVVPTPRAYGTRTGTPQKIWAKKRIKLRNTQATCGMRHTMSHVAWRPGNTLPLSLVTCLLPGLFEMRYHMFAFRFKRNRVLGLCFVVLVSQIVQSYVGSNRQKRTPLSVSEKQDADWLMYSQSKKLKTALSISNFLSSYRFCPRRPRYWSNNFVEKCSRDALTTIFFYKIVIGS